MDANVESVEQMEILRILGERRDSEHSASELALVSQVQPSAIGAQLAALEQRGLVKTQLQGDTIFCRYGPSTEDKKNLLDRLLQLYKERPVTLIRLIYDRTALRLKAFTDAFRLRKDN
jgi:DNA-binding transcriptional ArsR family regulator